ncbi:glutamate--cysteine ligase Ecym_6350 [Eremothecium cymbalariae DBVPG|uniref:Glutamate--cysteine ligase n=1 Tax=Eremothecium cymbalariae (strain CBS 270.75 / DBVPG 7215 / KCTC 17166 / NRRL Y-17582) TaxID=931890 RepID=G8JUE6_ERECY|nr:hypothetical protein Ecym_6350 [Eremothecium cymbalariae DBVPG\
MGLLTSGTPLPWGDSRKYIEYVKKNGVEQLLYIFAAAAERDGDPLYWGDELEYMMCIVDDVAEEARLTVHHEAVIGELNGEYKGECEDLNVHFHPEYGRYMLEATPLVPYKGFNPTEVEENMLARRQVASAKLCRANVTPLSITVFPRMGCSDFSDIEDAWSHKNSASRSLYLPDEIINSHVRFPTLTANIRTRRGEKVCINIPMYRDERTPADDDTVYTRDWFPREDAESVVASKPGHVYLDAMGFGMGCSCLQLTFSAPNLKKARYLYDSLTNFAPIFLSVSAASPFFKGWLVDQDVRWNVISGAVDDRTPYERDMEPLLPEVNGLYGGIAEDRTSSTQRNPKSRYSTVALYLGGNDFYSSELNDIDVPINTDVFEKLQHNDIYSIDQDLARHFSHLFTRDPLVIFTELLDQQNHIDINHFENIQSTNWQSLRFKPPSQDATPDNVTATGWRVEFRTMESQITDFENAALATFIYLVVECLLTFDDDINAYIPISRTLENMGLAHNRGSIITTKFYWKNDFSPDADSSASMYTIDEIFHSTKNGIFALFIDRILKHKGYIANSWVELASSDIPKIRRLYYYLKLISDRTRGKLPNAAEYMRNFVLKNPAYQKDSRINKKINYELLRTSLRLALLDNSHGEVTEYFGEEIGNYILQNGL